MRALQLGHRSIWCTVLVLALTGCGSKGAGSGGGKTPPPHPQPAPPDPPGALLTSVGLDGMGYRLPPFSSCLRRADEEHRLPLLAPETFKVDGEASEWAPLPKVLSDAAGDAEASAEITLGAVALAGADLAVLLQAQVSDQVSLNLEFKNAYLRGGVLGSDHLLNLRVYRGALERTVRGSWQAVPAEWGGVGISGPNVEIRLSRGLIGEILTYPVWSIRAFTRHEALSVIGDTTQSVLFSSWLDPDKPQFTLSTCKEWYTQHQPIELVEVREANPTLSPPDTLETLVKIQAHISQLGRLAIDATTLAFHGEIPPLLQLPVFETVGSAVLPSFDGPYDAVAINLQPFTSSGIDVFPDGAVFRRLTARLVEAYLLKMYPASPPGLRLAVNNALVDHLVRDAFGSSYFFDAYRDYLVPNDEDVAWGHVLSGVRTGDQLVEAWRRLAGGASVTTVFNDVPRENSLVQVGDSDHDGLPDHYEAVYGTDPQRQDTDGDFWSDLAEVVNSEDPLAQARQPSRIMPDGNFDDWLTLFPQKVHVDQGHSNICPVAADINFYAALATKDELLIGAVAREFWDDEPRASWEVIIDLPNAKRQFLISVPSDSYRTIVKNPETGKVLLQIERAFPQGRKTVEWVFRRQELKLDAGFDEPDSIRIRIRTLFHDTADKDNYCDETAWFAPYVNH